VQLQSHPHVDQVFPGAAAYKKLKLSRKIAKKENQRQKYIFLMRWGVFSVGNNLICLFGCNGSTLI